VKNRNTKDITNDKTGEMGQQENKIIKQGENVRRRRKRRRITRQKRKKTNNQEESYKLRKQCELLF
jgi:hypothetical protein